MIECGIDQQIECLTGTHGDHKWVEETNCCYWCGISWATYLVNMEFVTHEELPK